ncbi:YrhB domain-containing protein [Leptospira meyeri]|uniref:YrhB domain-containing protein n=1 Tax=Leptospira meyeri TaxID=29508 RepID=UPI001083F140|nr:YrhB domain-containing protein [Leptospira meyeri]TGL15866.1 hypothetical protein EHQ50_03075 [Leptospira meyeri]
MNIEIAKQKVQIYLDKVYFGEDSARIIDELTIIKPYGWIFFYQSKKYLETKDNKYLLFGTGPILLNRGNNFLCIFGSYKPAEYFILEYEKGNDLSEKVLID